jgi:hypothetical protein
MPALENRDIGKKFQLINKYYAVNLNYIIEKLIMVLYL